MPVRDQEAKVKAIFDLLPDLCLFMFANMLVWANRIRVQADASTAEYAFDVEFCMP